MDLAVPFRKSYIKDLTSNVMVIEHETCGKKVELDEVIREGSS